MWGEIMIAMYRLWLHDLYGLYGPRCLLSPERPLNLITLTHLDFQGQTLKMLYLRNERTDWHGAKGMRVDRMLHPLCDFQRSPHPWPWAWIFKVKFWKSRISVMGWPIDMESKGWVDRMLEPCFDFQCPPHPWPWPLIFKVKFWKCCISGMGGPIDMERKGLSR